jgi:serine protease Do
MNSLHGYQEVAEKLRRSTVQVQNGAWGGGAGVVWDDGGTVVTNAHVVRGRGAVVVDHRGRRFRARVTMRDAERDLALLETKAADLEPAAVGDSDSLRPGHIAIAVGSPFGLAGAVTAGIIHARGPLENGPRGEWIQADIRLSPGNSGGMLADAHGRVIGINSMIWRGLGLAAPSNEVDAFVRGETPLRLGVEIIPVASGLLVGATEPGSLAERAGLLVGDVILCGVDELRRLLRVARRNGVADLPISRGGKTLTLRIENQTPAGARAA